MGTLTKGSLFPETLVKTMFNTVKGKSSLAALANSEPVPFNGKDIFTFALDKEVDIVAENGAKGVGGATIAPKKILPIKFEYGVRISDEFKYASEEAQLAYLGDFAQGFAKKLARGMDIAALHGLNPRTKAASGVVGTNNFDSEITNSVTYGTGTPDADIEAAIALVTAVENDVNGIYMAPALRAALSQMTTANGDRVYPQLAWGAAPTSINGLETQVNSAMSFNSSTDMGLVGDFTAFKWGYAKDVSIEMIEYGDPDNTGADLKGHNQVYLRGEAYIGWCIMDPEAFAFIK